MQKSRVIAFFVYIFFLSSQILTTIEYKQYEYIFCNFLFHPGLIDSGAAGVTMTLRDEDESLECSAPQPDVMV